MRFAVTKNFSREKGICEFLQYIRHLKIFVEEQSLQQLPVSMQSTEAVGFFDYSCCQRIGI